MDATEGLVRGMDVVVNRARSLWLRWYGNLLGIMNGDVDKPKYRPHQGTRKYLPIHHAKPRASWSRCFQIETTTDQASGHVDLLVPFPKGGKMESRAKMAAPVWARPLSSWK